MPVRLALAAFALVALLHPSEQVAALACLPIVLTIAFWLLRRRPAAALDAAKPVFAASFAKPESGASAE